MADYFQFQSPTQDADWQAFLSYRQRQQDFADSTTSDVGLNVAALAAHYTTLSPGVALALGRAGVKPGDPLAEQASQLAAEQAKEKVKDKPWWQDMFNSTIRGGMTALEYPFQELSGAARTLGGNIEKEGLVGGLAAPFNSDRGIESVNRQTNLGQIVNAAGAGQPIDTGSGFFVNSESGIGKAQSQAARDAWTVDGHAATLGRVVAGTILPSDTYAYNAVSGLVDFANTLAFDPSNVAGGELAKARVAGKLFQPVSGPAAHVFDKNAHIDAGAILGHRPALAGDIAQNWLDSRAGRTVTDKLVGMDSPTDIRNAMRGKIDMDMAVELADAQTPEAVRDIIKQGAIDARVTQKPYTNGVASWKPVMNTAYALRRRAEDFRILSTLPSAGGDFLLADATQSAEMLDRTLKNANYKVDEARKWTDQVARAKSREDRRTIILNALSDIDNKRNGPSAIRVGDMVRRNDQGEYGKVEGINKDLGTVQLAYRNQTTDEITKVSHPLSDLVHQKDDISGQAFKEATRLYKNTSKDFQTYNLDDTGKEKGIEGLTVNGVGHSIAQPIMWSQMQMETLPGLSRDDIIAIRRATAAPALRGVLNNSKYQTSADLARSVGGVWRDFALLRGAYTLRVVGEEQLRLAANRLDSLTSFHPLSAMAWAIGDKAPVLRAFGQEFDVRNILKPRGTNDALGAGWTQGTEDEGKLNKFQQAHMQMHAGKRWAINTQFDGWKPTGRGDEEFVPGWSTELGQQHADPIVRRLAGGWKSGDDVKLTGNDVQDVKEWFFNGPGQEYRLDLAARSGQWANLAEDRALSDRYIQFLHDDVLMHKTGGDPDLLNLVAHGILPSAKDRVPLAINSQLTHPSELDAYGDPVKGRVTKNDGRKSEVQYTRDKLNEDNEIEVEKWREIIDNNTIGRGSPAATADGVKKLLEQKVAMNVGPEMVRAPVKGIRPEKVKHYRNAVDHLFDWLLSKPSNTFSRSTAFRQYYWERVAQILPDLSPEEQARALKNAESANLDSRRMQMLRSAQARGSGELSLESADLLAKQHALDSTKKLLYDLGDRSQFFDQAKVIAPFGEAWKEAMATWLAAFSRNPAQLYRLKQGVEGAQNADPDMNGHGFFYTDENGQEVFNYPLSAQVSQFATGTFTPLKGSVKGLNLAGNGLPGLGPVIQVGMSALVRAKPNEMPDWLVSQTLPSGKTDYNNGLIEAFLPGWMKRGVTALTGQATHNATFDHTVGNMARYKLSTGQYDISTEEGMAKLEKDSIHAAKSMYWLRTLAQFVAPTAPSPEWMAKDKDGHLWTAAKLMQDFRDLKNNPAIGYENAEEAFLMKYGEKALLYMQPLSEGGFEPTTELHQWVKQHPEAASSYRDVYGYFAGDGGDYSSTEYERQVALGERTNLSPRQIFELGNQRVAALQYAQARSLVGPTPSAEQSDALRNIQMELMKNYPGYQPGATNKKSTDYLIKEASRAIEKDAAIRNSSVGQAAGQYIQVRNAIEEIMPGYRTSKQGAGVRAVLRNYGNSLSAANPEFSRMWIDLLQREIKDDTAA